VDVPQDPETALAGRMKDESPEKSQPKAAAKKEPKAPSTPEELKKAIAESEYELGGIFFLDLGMPDSALAYYERLVNEYPVSPLVPKAIYAMSEAHRILGDTAAVDSLYDRILADHPGTEYARQVKKTRGLDTAAVLESADAVRYREAETALFAGESEKALASFKHLSAAAKDTVVAPKSRYAVGWIYENVLIDLDSADTWYKLLIKEYPASVYASNAEPRVAVRGDTSKLGQYVKYKKIEVAPRPQKKALGQVPKEGGRGSVPGQPGDLNKPPVNPDDDEYFNPGDDEDEKDPADDEPADDEPVDPDDDPGRSPDQR
jgi:tetratricopeptide (TPR) repeat protein